MNMKQSVLRVAAAVAATVLVGVGAVGPVYAEDNDASATSSQGQEAREKKPGQERKAGETESTETESTSTSPDHTDGTAATEGDVDGEQPESTADQNDGGANSYDCEEGPEGPYCGTERTEDSANGKGDGDATGRPGAGTVGKADNKNPRGQEPGPNDANGGYECDGNEGIAKGNPAHTGCTESEEKPAQVTCPEGATMNAESECVVPTEADGTCPVDATMEEGECLVPPLSVDQVAGVQAERSAVLGAQAVNRAPVAVAPAAGILPATGAGEYTLAVVAGVGLLAVGGVLLARRRLQAGR